MMTQHFINDDKLAHIHREGLDRLRMKQPLNNDPILCEIMRQGTHAMLTNNLRWFATVYSGSNAAATLSGKFSINQAARVICAFDAVYEDPENEEDELLDELFSTDVYRDNSAPELSIERLRGMGKRPVFQD